MELDIQYKIKNNSALLSFLRENSYYYKYLNRNPIYFNSFEEKMKETYKLRPQDKLNNFADNIQMISAFMEMMK
ncbi:MAG: YlbE-like family protein [Bacilli bacterium]